MNYLEEIVARFPVRRKAEQKKAFRDWAVEEIRRMGYSVKVEQNGAASHQNIVVGNPEKAPMLFTAHYDTPSTMGLPNIMMPRNPVLAFAYVMLMVLILLGGSAIIMLAVGGATGNPGAARIAWIATYFGALMYMNFGGVANKNNVNDNTSGVAAMLTMLAQLPEEDRAKAAFIFFDNEEKGLAGSKAYTKDHQQVAYTRLTVNMDCIGVGEHIMVISRKLSRQHREFAALQRSMEAITTHQVHFFDAFGSVSNSDWKNFKSGVSISACKHMPVIGYYTSRIHTKHDTEANPENIAAIANALTACVQNLTI